MTFDGRAQRKALTAAEQAVQALGAGEGTRATAAAERAAQLDQVGAFAGLPAAVWAAVADLASSGEIDAGTWDGLAAAVGPGPLAVEVAMLRSRGEAER